MKSLKIGLAIVVSAVIGAIAGCGLIPQSALPVSVTRAEEVAAIASVEKAFSLTAEMCVALASKAGETPTQFGCGQPLIVAQGLLVSAAAAVDTKWDQNAACDLLNAATLIGVALAPMDPPGSINTVIKDAIDIANTLVVVAGSCPAVDAGNTDAAPTPVVDAAPDMSLSI